MWRNEEIDENVIAIALYKLREVNGVESVERIILPPVATPYPMFGFNPMANQGVVLKINGTQCFLHADEARDMCHNEFGTQAAENFVNKILGK